MRLENGPNKAQSLKRNAHGHTKRAQEPNKGGSEMAKSSSRTSGRTTNNRRSGGGKGKGWNTAPPARYPLDPESHENPAGAGGSKAQAAQFERMRRNAGPGGRQA